MDGYVQRGVASFRTNQTRLFSYQSWDVGSQFLRYWPARFKHRSPRFLFSVENATSYPRLGSLLVIATVRTGVGTPDFQRSRLLDKQ